MTARFRRRTTERAVTDRAYSIKPRLRYCEDCVRLVFL